MLRPWLLIALLACVLTPVRGDAQDVGGTFVLTALDESGSIYDPADGSIVRFVTALSPEHVIYEERNFFDLPTGMLRRAADLSTAPPMVTSLANGPVLFASDGISPFSDSTLYHPTLFSVGDPLLRSGLYVSTDTPTGAVEFFTSIGGGFWVHAGTPTALAATGGEGVVEVLRIEAPAHAEGTAIAVYYTTVTGAVRVILSEVLATGDQKFIDLDPLTDQEVLPDSAVLGGFAATGGIVPFPSGSIVFFFVPADRSYLGIAESTDPLSGWQVTRGAADPILSTSTNASAPDPGRSEILELSVFPSGAGVMGYTSGAIPGLGSFSRSVGRVVIESPFAMDPSVAFRRGDANASGAIDIVDAVFTMQYLFAGGGAPVCFDAADDNDDGGLDILDPVHLLQYVFAGGPPPPSPFLSCARDLTSDALLCESWPPGCSP